MLLRRGGWRDEAIAARDLDCGRASDALAGGWQALEQLRVGELMDALERGMAAGDDRQVAERAKAVARVRTVHQPLRRPFLRRTEAVRRGPCPGTHSGGGVWGRD
jgi:hypothetical protein